MKYSIEYEKRCLKYLKKLDKNTQLRVINAINELPLGDVKRLKGSTDNYRLRVGSFRIVFCRDDKNLIILVLEIGSRGKVYNKL